MRIPTSSRERGSVLVGATALAVIVAVAASLAIRSAQHKLNEARSKEANIEARLALDSAAARLLHYLDLAFEAKGLYRSEDLTQWAAGQGTVIAEPYRVNFAATNDVLPQPMSLSVASVARSPLIRNPADPLYPDLAMNRTNLYVDLIARSDRPAYPDFKARYTFQLRAVPVTEWAVFNPGQHREQVSVQRDPSYADHTADHAYIGTLLSGGFDGIATLLTDASVADANHRLWREGGVAKYPNAASLGVLSFNGDFPVGDVDWDAYDQWGALHSSTDADGSDAAMTGYDSLLNTASPGRAIGTTPSYLAVTIPPNNPLADGVHDQVALLDLASYLTESSPPNGAWLVPSPDPTRARINTILVTNSAVLGTPGDTFNLTFPPSIQVFFSGDVNTNLAHLKIEGNIGFIPAGVDVLSITNFTGNQRTNAPVFSTNAFETFTRSDVTLDPENQMFVAHQKYMQLHQQLYRWATNIQAGLLSNPSSPYYVPQADQENYFLDSLAILFLANTVVPIVTRDSDSSTNQILYTYTNVFNRYNYAGHYEGGQVCGLNQELLVALDPTVEDPHLANALGIPGTYLLNSQETFTNTTVIDQAFAAGAIRDLDAKLPVLSGNRRIQATLLGWTPTNRPVAFPAVTPANIRTLPYAEAYITIHTNYCEAFNEDVATLQSTGGRQPMGTNSTASAAVEPGELHPWGGTWRDYLWNSWSAGIGTTPYLGMFIEGGQGADSERYDPGGNWNTNNSGAWKITTTGTFQDELIPTPGDQRSDADIALADPEFFHEMFVSRTVRFNYQTAGWTTTLAETAGPAPAFNGRLVVEDGIKRLAGYLPENLVINGQLSYTHRTSPQSAGARIMQFTVNHNKTTIPAGSPDRVFDIRISRIDFNRL